MILIIGGAYQGKLEYARERFPNAPVVQCGEQYPEPDLPECACIINAFHLFILAQLRAGKDPLACIGTNIDILRNKIILCDAISCGVVPVSPEGRQWREAVGRCLGLLSRNSESVIRLFCGIPSVLK